MPCTCERCGNSNLCLRSDAVCSERDYLLNGAELKAAGPGEHMMIFLTMGGMVIAFTVITLICVCTIVVEDTNVPSTAQDLLLIIVIFIACTTAFNTLTYVFAIRNLKRMERLVRSARESTFKSD